MIGVLRRNPQFRRLWTAMAISQIGDWLNRVAVLTLLGQLGVAFEGAALGIGLLFGLEIAVRFLPATLLGVFVGPLADRWSRKRLMIGTDIVRAALMLLLLQVDEASDLPLLYAVLFLQMVASLLFEAARSASIPNTLRREDLLLGNALASVTWSVMLSVGGLLGAIATSHLGVRGVFLLDAASFLVSAALLVPLRLPTTAKPTERLDLKSLLSFRDLRRAARHAREVFAWSALAAKTAWGGAGGFLVVLSLAALEYARSVVPGYDQDPAATKESTRIAAEATGISYALRGLGTAVGPFLGRRFIGSEDASLRRQITAGFAVGILGYAAFGATSGYGLGLVFVVLAHMGGSVLWVSSTTLWQRQVDDRFRGRAHTLENTGMMGASALGAMLTGLTYDLTGSFRLAAWTSAALVVAGLVAWTCLSRWEVRRREAAGRSATDAIQN